uniref:THAP-type domain-containing protein n=1 Tax=Bombyx mori TaxID=7091 RepID=A0A8R2M854_BOMMO|nr:uncharacterized protein LOC119630429 isoform X2 [Bombyx mori]
MPDTHRTCEVCGIKERHLTEKRFFARFPLDVNRCKQWVKMVGKEDLAYLQVHMLHDLKHVCEAHFSRRDFTKSKKRLKKRAVPKLNLTLPPLRDEILLQFLQLNSQADVTPQGQFEVQAVPCTSMPTSSSQSSSLEKNVTKGSQRKESESQIRKRKLEDVDVTPRKRKLLSELRKTKCTLASLKKSAKLIDNLSSEFLKEIVTSALINQKRKSQGKRWTIKNKISALAIFKRSPKAYRYLRYLAPFPSIKTLQKLMKKIPVEPGLNTAVLDHPKKLAPIKKIRAKLCSLVFDEIALKERLTYSEATDKVEGFIDYGYERKDELANHALVFMLQGIGRKIKQPLAFYFIRGTVSSEKLAVLIKDIIKEITNSGFQVLSTICDQAPTNMGALSLLKEWNNGGHNYFEFENKKIYIIYDIPHLLKSLRNNFLKQGFLKMGELKGQWSHLVEVEERNRNFLYLSKLKSTHVQPKYRAKMKVKYAAQIFSQTVAAVLKLLATNVENVHRSDEILQTALLIEKFNKLFDYTNGPSGHADVKKGIRENVSAKTDHLAVWTEYRKQLSTLTFFNHNGVEAKNVKCVQGYIISLKSLRDIWLEVQDLGYKYLNLRQLNQDALENLFGLIRQHGQTNKHPTCSTFIAAMKTSIISGLTAPHSKNSNCEEDKKELMTDFHDLVFGFKDEDDQGQDINESPSHVSTENENEEDNPVLSIPEEEEYKEIVCDLAKISNQPVVYISGYLASVILKKNDCQVCRETLTVADPEENKIYDLIKLREWWQDKKCLTYPSLQLCQTVHTAVTNFEQFCIPNLHNNNICQWTITIFYSNCNTEWLCINHRQQMSDLLFTKLALMLIRRQCQIINLKQVSKEEDLADANKRGQQYGVSR